MSHAIHSDALTRRFGKIPAVEGLDLRVPEGSITAFLGPNGAGKTTTIRLLLGLLKPSGGSCEVLGRRPGHPETLRQLGAMVEAPSLYGHLTGRENVEITRLMRGAPRTETDRVLQVVGLQQDARRIVQQYSLGMRQRLALALALLGHPRLLVLDEPTNGLDPSGIQEMRELIRRVPETIGATVFLSSHILAEVEQIASQVVVIHRGRLRYQGPMDGMGHQGPALLQVRVDDPARAAALLRERGHIVTEAAPHLLVQVEEAGTPAVAAALVGGGLALYELAPRRRNLEARFLDLLGAE
jgi:ABC-2 type transport system ATP-binding protein